MIRFKIVPFGHKWGGLLSAAVCSSHTLLIGETRSGKREFHIHPVIDDSRNPVTAYHRRFCQKSYFVNCGIKTSAKDTHCILPAVLFTQVWALTSTCAGIHAFQSYMHTLSRWAPQVYKQYIRHQKLVQVRFHQTKKFFCTIKTNVAEKAFGSVNKKFSFISDIFGKPDSRHAGPGRKHSKVLAPHTAIFSIKKVKSFRLNNFRIRFEPYY